LAEAPFNALWSIANLNIDFGETIPNHVRQIESFVCAYLCAKVEQYLYEWPHYFARVA
jgi:hypothetical protein